MRQARSPLRDMPLGRGALLVLALCAAAGALNALAKSDTLRGFVGALFRGEIEGAAMWFAIVGLGILGGCLMTGLVYAADKLAELANLADRCYPRDRADDVPPVPTHRSLEELPPIGPAERRRRARFTSTITALAFLAVPLIALTR